MGTFNIQGNTEFVVDKMQIFLPVSSDLQELSKNY